MGLILASDKAGRVIGGCAVVVGASVRPATSGPTSLLGSPAKTNVVGLFYITGQIYPNKFGELIIGVIDSGKETHTIWP